MPCPCDNSDCHDLVNFGDYARFGKGSMSCIHCGLYKEGTYGFRDDQALKEHVTSEGCLKRQGRTVVKGPTPRNILGPVTRHKLDSPEYRMELPGRKGPMDGFKCLYCSKKLKYTRRLKHAVDCWKNHTNIAE